MKRSVRALLAERLAPYDPPPSSVDALATLLRCVEPAHAPTSVHDALVGVDVHIADSLVGLDVSELRAAASVADLGAGAGLPGLVLAAMLPATHVVLVESLKRKCAFLRQTVAEMHLDNVEVVCARVEEWRDGQQACDVVTARALASLPVLFEYAAPLLREDGVLIAWKGEVPADEAVNGAAAAEVLGLAVDPPRAVTPYPGSARRTLHVARKIAPTPPTFPRRAGMASKRPLTVTKVR